MIFTVNYYTGPDPDFFAKLAEMRNTEVPREKVKEYDHRQYMPFKGNVRTEDIMTQATQSLLGERKEHLATSDRGVILLRKIILNAIETVQKGGRPKGVLTQDTPDAIVKLDSFTGVQAMKGKKMV